jgi:protein TonB
VAAPPPPRAEEPPPPPPPPEREPPPPPPNLDSPMSPPLVADLDMALGVGGAMAGLVDLRAMTQGAGASDLFDVTDLERRPEVVSQVPPAYPAELRKARVEGSVLLVFVVAEDGSVVDPRVESASRPEFEKPALDALKRWRFRPGTKDGEPVRTYMRLPMRFRVGG